MINLTKEELKQIYYLNKEIKMWQRELDKLECKSLVNAQVLTGMPHVTGISDNTANIAVDIADYKRIIEGKLAEIQIQRKKIIEYIESIDDSMKRQIIFLRNVSLMSWNQIAREIGGNNTENGVKQIYSRYFRAT